MVRRMNEREKALRHIQEMGFMTDDIRLFLNTHPDCEEALCALNHYIKAEKEAKEDYERCYGSLTLEGIENSCRYDWIDHAWPWEMEEC